MGTFEDELIGKTVMSEEGFVIGVIKDSMVDKTTGKSNSLLVKPSKEINPRTYKLNKYGDIIFSFDSIATVKDVVVLE